MNFNLRLMIGRRNIADKNMLTTNVDLDFVPPIGSCISSKGRTISRVVGMDIETLTESTTLMLDDRTFQETHELDNFKAFLVTNGWNE